MQAVISLAHGLGIDVVAEGIETGAQFALLRELACDRGQGYWFSRPLPDPAMEALLDGAPPDGVPPRRRVGARSTPSRPS